MVENEFGNDIPDEQIKEIADRILKLSDEKKDELWFRCGFIYQKPNPAILHEDKNKNLKAIFDDELDDIKKYKEESEVLMTFLLETPLEDVLSNLSKIEKE